MEMCTGDWCGNSTASTASGELGQRGGQLPAGDYSHDKGSKEEFPDLRAWPAGAAMIIANDPEGKTQ